MSDAPGEESKIIIDEGWKGRVEREREEALAEVEKAQDAPDQTEHGEGEEGSLLEQLVSGLAAQTLMALGLASDSNQTEVTVDMAAAKHGIDTLMMLRDKTGGNQTPREERLFREALSELQRLYATRAQQVQQTALQQGPNIKPTSPDLH